MKQLRSDINPRDVMLTDDARMGPPAHVTGEDLDAAQRKRASLTLEQKEEISRDAWASLLDGTVRFRKNGS